MFGADSVVTPFPTSIGGQPPSPLSVQGPLRHLVAPVTLPPGRLRLATQPSCTGSRLVTKTMGIVVVAALAGNVAALFAAITSTLRRTKSAASAGKRLY